MSNFNEVIEISDDSCDFEDDAPGTSGNCIIKKPQVDLTSSDSDDDDVQLIEDESESEPDLDCNLWDNDCVVITTKVNTKIQGIHHTEYISIPKPKDIKKIKLSAELNEYLKDETFFVTLKENYMNDNAIEEKHCELICDPWKVLVINNVLADSSILDNVNQEFNEIDWNLRTMDLYEFFQSEDLKNIPDEHISMVYEFLKGDLMSWVAKLTGLELVSMSATCSYYSDTDFLLVHDDHRGSRAVAFVLYLTGKEGWSDNWGGNLQLLNCDDCGAPLDVTRNIQPRHNQLVLFPVSQKSYHQVEEVQCKNFCRLSINGWFHVKETLTFETPLSPVPVDGLFSVAFTTPVDLDVNLADYTDESYLVSETTVSIQRYIEEHSEMTLEWFFKEKVLADIVNELQTTDIKWNRMGPPNRRSYHYLSDTLVDTLPEKLKSFLMLLKSKAFFDFLFKCTSLELKKMRWELQKWTPGSYSLLLEEEVKRLDVMFCVGNVDVVGGKTHYVTLDDEVQIALITTGCEANFLNLVYGDTSRYTSLISKYSKSPCFYMFVASYFEECD